MSSASRSACDGTLGRPIANGLTDAPGRFGCADSVRRGRPQMRSSVSRSTRDCSRLTCRVCPFVSVTWNVPPGIGLTR